MLLLAVNCDAKWYETESCETCKTKSFNAKPLLVKTKSGWIRGAIQHTYFKDMPFTSFIGIPFAEKPIGNLRFKVIFLGEN